MASSLSWMDFSDAEQKRSREIVQLFLVRESRDELGIGVLRDIMSDEMFPGISVLHQRARYLLLIPWIFQVGAKSKRGRDLLKYVEDRERNLIEVLRNGGDQNGLIGREAGKNLKILPSTMYWNGLQRLGILRLRGSKMHLANFQTRGSSLRDGATEMVDNETEIWNSTIPSYPNNFPSLDALNFDLTIDEASWLNERLIDACRGSLLGWLAENRYKPSNELYVWDEFHKKALPADIRRVVDHAKHLAVVMQGSTLIYNLLLAHKSESLGLTLREGPDVFKDEIKVWCQELKVSGSLENWDLNDFWHLTTAKSRVSSETQMFVKEWFKVCKSSDFSRLSSSARAHELIQLREKSMKRSQSRFTNERLLKEWGGRSGTQRLSYRWGQVQVLLNDIDQGLNLV